MIDSSSSLRRSFAKVTVTKGVGAMLRLAALIVLLIITAACDFPSTRVTPSAASPLTPPSSPTPDPTLTTTLTATLTIRQPLNGTFIGNPLTYEVAAPSGGTLVVRLSWDPTVPYGARFLMVIGECAAPTWFRLRCPSAVVFRSSGPDWSPLVGRLAIAAGQTYRVVVDEGVSPWDYGFNQPFTLMADLE
jgi:hypothetical protein